MGGAFFNYQFWLPKLKKTPKTSNKASTKIDRLVGRNIRVRRLASGLTQAELGAKLGVTFQQVQKYEKGINRIGSGRLYEIAEIFEVPVKSFFGGETKEPASRKSSPFELLADAMTMQMVLEFGKISDSKLRRAVLAVVETLAARA
jgi:transcriptional regulator with XRE-family HTH domain